MADRLTQIQDCLDQVLLPSLLTHNHPLTPHSHPQLATQMYASLHYISANHALSPIPTQPFDPKGLQPALTSASAPADPASPTSATTRAAPTDLAATLRELSRDLVIKEQQIELLVSGLPPGLREARVEQEARVAELEEELRALEVEARGAAERRRWLVERVEGRIGRARRV